VYFVIVSLATVGYGDEIPGSEFGRVIVLFIIFFTIVLIPAQTNELLRLMQIRSRFRRIEYKSLDMRHVVVCGYVDLDALEIFVDELFHSDHGNLAINAVVMQDHDPSGEMEEYLQKNKLSMTYLAGDVFEDIDLDRASMTRAEACTVLTNKNSKNSQQEDFKNILTSLAIKKFVYVQNQHLKDELKYNIKLCIQLIKPESKRLYYDSLNMSAAHD
jgi:voltage-gated potassium channel